MECTQRLDFECSQVEVERICPEQIGFLGILGTKYPVKRGPNKIGRDPHTCSIVLNKNSISRQHAVINVLSGNNYMLMDLDSANKTKLNNKSLQAYIPVPLTNGDTVQFGEVFGIFRLLEEETDLPCTQAIDIPDTPVPNKHASRIRQATVPESPDISDKDDSFIVPSQPKSSSQFKSPSNKFIKPSARTVTVPSIGSHKIDNIFWSSSKKSNSFNLDDSNASFNASSHNGDIHEAGPQAQTNESSDSIYTAETQLPTNNASPIVNLPAVCKINNQHEVELDLCTANKENEHNIYNAETQYVTVEKVNVSNLFEANTQLPGDAPYSPISGNNIFEANTQFPFDKLSDNNSGNSFEANTQMPFDKTSSEENNLIFEANTQLPFENLSKTQLSFELSEKTTADNILEANSQPSVIKTTETKLKNEKDAGPSTSNKDIEKQTSDICNELKNQKRSITDLNKSNEVILFHDLDTKDFLDDFQSQPILGSEPVNQDNVILNQDNEEDIPLSQSDTITDEDILVNQDENSDVLSQIKPTKRNIRIESGGSSENADILSQVKPTRKNICIESDESTDCEDIEMLPTQKIPAKLPNEEDLTDCEDDSNILNKNDNKREPYIDFENLATQVITEIVPSKPENNAKVTVYKKHVNTPRFEDMPTQVIPEKNIEDLPTQLIPEADIEDMPTQVIPEENIEDMPTQVIPEENIDDRPTQINSHKPHDTDALQFSEQIDSPFKVPLHTPIRAKRKDTSKANETTILKSIPSLNKSNLNNEDDEKYYGATQDILDDLCSQKGSNDSKTISNNNKDLGQVADDEVVATSEEGNALGDTFPYLDNEVPVIKLVRDTSIESSDGEDKVNKFVASLSTTQISDVIGVDIAKPKKVPSDPSDVEVTPKKLRPFKFMQTELPDSQEIKTSVSLSSRTNATESSSESETEKESQEQTPIVFRNKKRTKKLDVKKDLSTKFDVKALPTRIITRMRKPTSKVQESDAATRKRTNNILKPKYLTEQDDEVDTEIISENITRLRSKNEKKIISKVEEKSVNITKRFGNLVSTEVKATEKRNTNKNLNKDDGVIYLMNVDQTSFDSRKLNANNVKSDEPMNKSKENGSKTSSSKESKSKCVEVKSQSERKSDEMDSEVSILKPRPSRQKKETQEKITNYTISNMKGDESKVSSTSKVDEELNLTAATNKSTRNTRSKTTNINEEKSVIPEQDIAKRKRGRPKKDNGDKSKQQKVEDNNKEKDDKKRKKDETIKEPEEQTTRRSRRQKTVKVQPEKSESQPRTSRTHEQSTVYNISSESGADSPKPLKRPATLKVDVPSPKRPRSVASVTSGVTSGSNSSGVNSNSSLLRSTPSRGVRTHHVLFTAFPCEEVKGKLEKLGAVVVSDVLACSVVLTLSLRRTFKLLCAVGLGRPIVGPRWVQACVDTNTIVDPWQYLLKDETSEDRFKFSLAKTLAGPRGYLKGYNVSATPKVLPSAPEMKLIVECSGGTWAEGGARWAAVTCAADRALWPALRARGAALVSTEFILSGVLRQQANIDAYLIK